MRLGGRGAGGPWPAFREGGPGHQGPFRRVRLGGAHGGVAGLRLGAVLGVLSSLLCGHSASLRPAWRSVLGPCRAGCTCRCHSGGCGLTGFCGSSGLVWLVWRRVREPARVQGGRCGSLGGRGGLPSWRWFGSWRLTVVLGRLGLPGGRSDRNCGLRQPPLHLLCAGSSRTSRGQGGAGAGPAVEAVVPLGEAFGFRHGSYSVRRPWRAIPTTSQCVGGVRWAVPCIAGGGRSWLQPSGLTSEVSSIGIGVGGGRAIHPKRCATVPSPGRGSAL